MYKNINERAKNVMPGGITSEKHSLNSALCIDCAKGACVYDLNAKAYIDYNMGAGSIILGHSHPNICDAAVQACKKGINFNMPSKNETSLAELIVKYVANVDMVRFFSGESQAILCALTLAKKHTIKNKIICFSECEPISFIESESAHSAETKNGLERNDIILAQFNNLESVKNAFMQNPNEIAAVFIEPIALNFGIIAPENGFLNKIQELCNEHNALLILNETTTGFRLCMGGAQEFYAFKADIIVMGKIIGGGFPIGVIGASEKIMRNFAPLGNFYPNDGFSGNPVAMAAGVCMLYILQNNNAIFSYVNNAAFSLQKGFDELAKAKSVNLQVSRVGSLLSIGFASKPINNAQNAKAANENAYNLFFELMQKKGVLLPNVNSKIFYISAAHTPQHVKNTLEIASEVLDQLKSIDNANI